MTDSPRLATACARQGIAASVLRVRQQGGSCVKHFCAESRKINQNSSLKEVLLMPAPVRSSFNFSEATVLRWAMKAFLVGLFLGVAGALTALASH